MRHVLAAVWLTIVLAAAAYLTVLGIAGFPIRSDLLALLPHEERDPVLQQAKAAVARNLGRRILLRLRRHRSGPARSAAEQASKAIASTGLCRSIRRRRTAGRRSRSRDSLPSREVLLPADRTTPTAGKAEDTAKPRPAPGSASAVRSTQDLLAADPFLLMPAFSAPCPGRSASWCRTTACSRPPTAPRPGSSSP